MFLLPICGVLIVVVGIYKFLIVPAFLSPLSKIPAAHWTAHFSPLWILWKRYTNHENEAVYKLHMAYGPCVRLGPNELSLSCFEGGLKQIYLGGFSKTDFYKLGFKNYETENIFTFEDNATHSARKRMISHTFSKSYILSSASAQASVRDILFARLFPILQKAAKSDEPLEMLDFSMSYSMDSFVRWQFGSRLKSNLLENEEERRMYLDGFFGPFPYVFWTHDMPIVGYVLSKLGLDLVPSKIRSGWKAIEDWNMRLCDGAQKLISSGEELGELEKPTVFSQAYQTMVKDELVKTGSSRCQEYPLRLEIASDMFAHNSAAHETSGNTLTYCFYELSKRPEVQAKLREELLKLDAPFHIPSAGCAPTLPAPKIVDSLPFLEAVVLETLRLYPSVPGRQPRKTPKVCKLGGYENIPPNTTVQCYAWTLHQTPEIFPDPTSWKPERWIEASPEQLSIMRKWFWAFGSGARMCIGSNFAYFSMKHAVGAIYANFTTTIHDHGDMELQDGYLAGPKGKFLRLKFHLIE